MNSTADHLKQAQIQLFYVLTLLNSKVHGFEFVIVVSASYPYFVVKSSTGDNPFFSGNYEELAKWLEIQ